MRQIWWDGLKRKVMQIRETERIHYISKYHALIANCLRLFKTCMPSQKGAFIHTQISIDNGLIKIDSFKLFHGICLICDIFNQKSINSFVITHG